MKLVVEVSSFWGKHLPLIYQGQSKCADKGKRPLSLFAFFIQRKIYFDFIWQYNGWANTNEISYATECKCTSKMYTMSDNKSEGLSWSIYYTYHLITVILLINYSLMFDLLFSINCRKVRWFSMKHHWTWSICIRTQNTILVLQQNPVWMVATTVTRLHALYAQVNQVCTHACMTVCFISKY